MKEREEQGKSYKLYEYSLDEFKRLLGINWPGGVLTVEGGGSYEPIVVRMMVRPGEKA